MVEFEALLQFVFLSSTLFSNQINIS